MASAKRGQDEPVVIKKYANRRLYNTSTSSYVTLEHLRDMVKGGTEFTVHDAKTGDDITRSVLTQIIFEEEGKGQNMLPISFLRQLIQFYGDRLQAFIPSYLEMSMEGLAKNAEAVRAQITDALGGRMGLPGFEELARQNVQMFQRGLQMLMPFGRFGRSDAAKESTAAAESEEAGSDEITSLKAQLEHMRRQLDALANRKS